MITCAYALSGAWAATITGERISGSLENTGGKNVQTLVISTPGALAQWVEAGDFQDLGSESDLYSLSISGTLNAADFAALDALKCPAFSNFPRIDMSGVTLDDDASSRDVCSVNFGNGANYILLPNGITSADDVTLMADMTNSGHNSALKVVGAFNGTNQTLPELALYSFAENELSNFSAQMMNLADRAMVVRMAGTYGDKDLMNVDPVFGWTPPCIWDFTGATFTSCTLNPGVSKEYHAYNDPFCEEPTSKPGEDYQTNAFFYFSNYSTFVVNIKLPTEITALPPHSLNDLGAQNLEKDVHKNAYKVFYNVSDADLEGELKVPDKTAAVIPTLAIPDNYVTLDYECGTSAHIQHLVIGSGVKVVDGGAFYNCLQLEDLDFGAGISDCYLGEDAFRGQNNSVMKHIALSEGIVSIGANCFMNAQHLESIRLPQTLINIGNHAFDNCLALNSITIPQNVDKIGMSAFWLCPFTDIFLTTTDPNKIPEIFTGGNSFGAWASLDATFYHGHVDGWEGICAIDEVEDFDMLAQMTFDKAADWYFVNVNGLPVLHYPKQLAEKVRADISANYHAHSSDTPSLGLPTAFDMAARETAGGANVGTPGVGRYTRDGWAQFMLMKEFTTDPGGDVYTKEYDDVWYTMCFPFDLTDEQLAAAFNETFNIVDFSGVEVNSEEKALILHFNNVAVTDYKDTEGNHYTRKLNGNEVIREKDPNSNFSYNVYLDANNQEYHHVTTSSHVSSNKTKTFAKGANIADAQANFEQTGEAFIIDGVLATAGHPYMIHPAIGVNDGGTTKRRCDFSGIKWEPMTTWPTLFEQNSRTVDLGIEKKTDNFNQSAYDGYEGQTYTFVGNAKEYADGAQTAIGDEPQVPEEPIYPVQPDRPTENLPEPSKTLSEPTPLTADEQELLSLLTEGKNQHEPGPWKDVTEIITAEWSDSSDPLVSNYINKFYIYSSTLTSISSEYATNNNANEAGFNYCKTTFNKSISYASDYAAYLANKAEWDAYNANQAAWDVYNNWNQTEKVAEYNTLKDAYDRAVIAHTAWENNAKSWKVQIPKNAYFLGRKAGQYPKYYREMSAESYGGNRTTGLWPQFTAVVIPNDRAIAGIEKKIDSGTALSKGFEMKFNEDFEGDFIDEGDIQTIIEDARKEGIEPKVEYMDVVVNINGQVVRRDSTSFEGLPKGIYIVNGKKYFVK